MGHTGGGVTHEDWFDEYDVNSLAKYTVTVKNIEQNTIQIIKQRMLLAL